MRPTRPNRDSRRDSGRRLKTLSTGADATLWRAYRAEQGARLTRGKISFDHFEKDARLRRRALAALEKLRWIDEKIFPFGDTRQSQNAFEQAEDSTDGRIQAIADNTYATQPINAVIDLITRRDASEQDREGLSRERAGAPDIGAPDELGIIGRAMTRLVAKGEPLAAVVRHYDTHARGKGGLPDIPADLLRDRLRKRSKSRKPKR